LQEIEAALRKLHDEDGPKGDISGETLGVYDQAFGDMWAAIAEVRLAEGDV
jgi:hypothetical protein